MTGNQLRAAVVAQAREWLDAKIKEADGSHREIIDLYNDNRLASTYKMTYADPWCAAFVSAVGMAVGLRDVILPHVNCDGMIAAYKAAGRWVEDDGYLPTPGDVIFYDWQDDGRGDNRGSSDHVGLVVTVEGSDILVIEGNISDSVGTRKLHRDGRYIRGYAVPDYERAAGGASPSPTEKDGTPGAASPTGQTGAVLLDRPDGAVDMSGSDQSGASPYTGEAKAQGSQTRETVTVSLPVLRYGDTGETVRAAQGILIARGISVGPDKADGDFGRNTRNGVCTFQRSRGLAVDGVIGAETWAALLGATN